MIKTVAVVGLGPSGLSVVKELREAGFKVTGFDGHLRVGGRWSLESDAGVWKELCMNATRRQMSFSDFPWKKEDYEGRRGVGQDYANAFPHCTEAAAYLEDYAKHFDLYPSLKLQTKVIDIVQTQEGWNITSESKQMQQTDQFDGLVMCTGAQAVPHHPLIESLMKKFAGEVLHSEAFKSIYDYEGKRVLVIGSSVSGSEIAGALANEGKCTKVVNSVRHVPYHIDKVSPTKNVVVDEYIYSRLPIWLERYLPESVTSKGLKSVVIEYNKQITEEMTGLAPVDDIRQAGATLCYNYIPALEKGSLQLKPSVASVQGTKVTFDDGSSDEFDVVICGTGYDFELPLLPKAIQDKIMFKNPFSQTNELVLYKWTLVPGIENLVFAGFYAIFGPHFSTCEMQGRYIAAIFSGSLKRPSNARMEKEISKLIAHRKEGAFNRFHVSLEVTEALGDDLGLTPSVFEALTNPKDLLFAPIYPHYYRTRPEKEGKERARKYQALVDCYLSNPQKVEAK